MGDVKPPKDHVDRLRAQWARELPDLDTEPMAVLGRIYRLTHLLRSDIEASFARFGLDRGEFDVLGTLRRAGPPYRLTPTDLYTSLMIASGSLTHRLGRLERAGLIERVPSPDDGRSLMVVLTPQGRERAEQAFRADMAIEGTAIAHLTARDRKQLARLLRQLMSGLEPMADSSE